MSKLETRPRDCWFAPSYTTLADAMPSCATPTGVVLELASAAAAAAVAALIGDAFACIALAYTVFKLALASAAPATAVLELELVPAAPTLELASAAATTTAWHRFFGYRWFSRFLTVTRIGGSRSLVGYTVLAQTMK